MRSESCDYIILFIDIGIPVSLLTVAFITGRIVDCRRKNYLARMEKELSYINYTTMKTVPSGMEVASAEMICGSVVVANNYFKQFLSSFRNIFGGEMKSYQILLEHARRMAIVRMLEEARKLNADVVVNVRLETSSIQGNNQRKAAAGVELIAYGTALVRS